MNTERGPFQLDTALLSNEDRNNARTSVQVALGIVDAYRASGTPQGETLGGFERWLRDTEIDLEEQSNARTDPALQS